MRFLLFFSLFFICVIFCSFIFFQEDNLAKYHLAQKKIPTIAKKIAKINGLRLLAPNQLWLVDEQANWSGWLLDLVDRRQLTAEQAKELTVRIANQLFNELKKDRIFHDALRELVKNDPNELQDTELNANRIGLKIAFWDENMNRYPKPYISQVRVARGIISYYVARPDQSLEFLSSEPLILTP